MLWVCLRCLFAQRAPRSCRSLSLFFFVVQSTKTACMFTSGLVKNGMLSHTAINGLLSLLDGKVACEVIVCMAFVSYCNATLCFPVNYSVMDSQEERTKEREKSPMENANIFSLLFFWWMNDTLKLGSKRPLQDEDLFALQDDFKTEALVEKLEVEWSKECEASFLNNKRPGLWKAMFRMFSNRKYFLLAGVKLIHSITNALLPVMVWYFLATLSEDSNIDRYSAVKYVVCICLITMLKGISQHHSFFLAGISGMQLGASVIGLIYKKVRFDFACSDLDDAVGHLSLIKGIKI